MNLEEAPAWIDFNMSYGSMKIPGSIEIIDDQTIVIEQFAPTSNHPTEFSDSLGTIVRRHALTREAP